MATDLVDRTVERLRLVIEQRRQAREERLPPETELSTHLGVGRSTLREALARLEAEGIIDRRRRTGTTIRAASVATTWGPDAPAYPVHLILALSDFLSEAGIEYEIQELSIKGREAEPQVATALGLVEGARVFEVGRLYAIGGLPGAHLQHYLPTEIRGKTVKVNALRDGATTFLQEIEHIDLSNVESRITAEAATSHQSTTFDVPEGSPLLAMYARISGRDIGPVALGRLVFRPDVVSLSVRAVEQIHPVDSGTTGSLGQEPA